jgi:2-polyprenyl-3-methyl-5-hydroxy-6-metoxy-1,4-benzoquinol methylase
LHLHRCGVCDVVFVHPQPRQRVRTKYLEQYNLAEYFSLRAARKRVLYERRLAALPPPPRGHTRLCDVGCGDGQFLEMAAARGWKVYGIELNPPAAAAARARGMDVATGVLEQLDDLPWGQFDLVTSWDVLEHTPDPRPFSSRLIRLLAPSGRLVVTTLNYDSLVRRCFGLGWSMVGDDHFTYWNARSLRRLFESGGLRLEASGTFGLGRDFLRSLDRRSLRRDRPAVTDRSQDALPAQHPTWDVHPVVLTVERALNAVMRVTGAGVGIEATFRRPAA